MFNHNLVRLWLLYNHIAIYISVMSLKCYISASTKSDCSSLVPDAKYCAKITLSSGTAYSCTEEPQKELGLDKSTITETLACYDRTVDPLKGEYCFCSTDNCNDPSVATSDTLEKSIPLKVINLHLYLTMHSS